MRFVEVGALAAELEQRSARELGVVVSGNYATPYTLLGIIDRLVPSYRLFTLNGQRGLPDREGVTHVTPFVGPGVRSSSRLEYVPARLSLVPLLFGSTHVPDLVLLHTTGPRDGRVSLGIEVNVLPAAIEQARRVGGLVVAQVNEHMPWTYGDAEISTDQIDFAVHVDEQLIGPSVRRLAGVAETIGERIAGLVPDGATLQLGIGAVPDATVASLARRRGLRIWTEMFSDGVLDLERAGSLDVDRPLVASFLFGSPELYAWVDGNPRVLMRRIEATNDPAAIASQPAMTSVNGALQVDLFGQANASWVRGRIHSGFGGQSDFVAGALHSRGGAAIIAMPSWHERADCSTIVSKLDGPATSFQHSWVVTEYGAAAIWPCSAQAQATHLIQVAHPDARDDLARSRSCLSFA